MIKNLTKVLIGLPICLSTLTPNVAFSRDYIAPKAQVAPTIDGVENEECWKSASWNLVDQTILGITPVPSDFSGRFKLAWDSGYLYLLGEITDDSLSDTHPSALTNYWDDDAFEILVDENHSGGPHNGETNAYNAFAYHVSKSLDIVDTDKDNTAKVYKDLFKVKWTKKGNVYTWECAIPLFTDAFVYGVDNNPTATLTEGKKVGFALAYCDNDGGTSRQSFMASEEVTGTGEARNVFYQNASSFGTVTLVNDVTPTSVLNSSMNDVDSQLPLTCTFYNNLGQEIGKSKGTKENVFNSTGLPKGMYNYKIQTAEAIIKTGKVLID